MGSPQCRLVQIRGVGGQRYRPSDCKQAQLRGHLHCLQRRPGGNVCKGLIKEDSFISPLMYEATKLLTAKIGCVAIQMGGWPGGFDRETFLRNGMSDAQEAQDRYCQITTDLVLQLQALSTTDVFTGSYNSNLARINHLLRFHVFGLPEQSARDVLRNIEWHHDYGVRPS